MTRKAKKKTDHRIIEVPKQQQAGAFIARRLIASGINGTVTKKLVEGLLLSYDAGLLPDDLGGRCKELADEIEKRENGLRSGMSAALNGILDQDISEAKHSMDETRAFRAAFKYGRVDGDKITFETVLDELDGCRMMALEIARDIESRLIPNYPPLEINSGQFISEVSAAV